METNIQEKDLFLTTDKIYWKLLSIHNDFIEEYKTTSYWDDFIRYVDENSDIIVDSEEFKEAIKLVNEDENDFENKVRESLD